MLEKKIAQTVMAGVAAITLTAGGCGQKDDCERMNQNLTATQGYALSFQAHESENPEKEYSGLCQDEGCSYMGQTEEKYCCFCPE
jgi:outer membrane lipoprotein-sorting protein